MMPAGRKAGDTFGKGGYPPHQNRTRCCATQTNDKYTYKNIVYFLGINSFRTIEYGY